MHVGGTRVADHLHSVDIHVAGGYVDGQLCIVGFYGDDTCNIGKALPPEIVRVVAMGHYHIVAFPRVAEADTAPPYDVEGDLVPPLYCGGLCHSSLDCGVWW